MTIVSGLLFLCGAYVFFKLFVEKYDSITGEHYMDVQFTGTIEGMNNGCHADGTCSLIVSGNSVAYEYGWGDCDDRMGEVDLHGLKSTQDISSYAASELVGRKVAVYARKITRFQNGGSVLFGPDEEITLCGSRSYHIREL